MVVRCYLTDQNGSGTYQPEPSLFSRVSCGTIRPFSCTTLPEDY